MNRELEAALDRADAYLPYKLAAALRRAIQVELVHEHHRGRRYLADVVEGWIFKKEADNAPN